MSIENAVRELVLYGLATGLIEREDKIYITNRLLELFGLDGFTEEYEENDDCVIDMEDAHSPCYNGQGQWLEKILSSMLDYACEKGLTENGIVYRDLFDARIMSILVARPSTVISKFKRL